MFNGIRILPFKFILVFAVLLQGSLARHLHPSQIHKHMSKKELARIFGANSHEEVPEYDIAHPTKVDEEGAFVSHRLSEHDNHKTANTDKLHYNMSAFGEHFNLQLKKNHKLLGKNLEVEFLGHKGKVLRKEKVKNCFYHGHSRNHRHSRAALSNCDNLAGVVHVKKQSYFIEPLPERLTNRFKRSYFEPTDSVPHIIYRKTSVERETRSLRDSSQKRNKDCGTDDDPRVRLQRSVELESDRTRKNDQTDPEKYIETMVVADEKMCDFHGEDAAKQFSLAACNIASDLLKDYTIGSNPINLVITKMQIHTVPQEGLLVNNHAMNSLSSFGQWAERNTVPDDSDPQHYDYATLFTRYDICKDKNQPCDTLGVSNVGGMCQFPNSVSICEDNGLMVGKTLAHETGHALGMNHDVRPFCGDSRKMMSLEPQGHDAYEWSKCSRMFLRQFLDSPSSRCLDDRPLMKRAINLEMFNEPGLLYDANQQCELAFGDGAKYCHDKSMEERCSKLWCSTGNTGDCRSLNEPLADGTSCGKTKWCKRGSCVEKDSEGSEVKDGGWSAWSKDYTECTRSCSSGVQFRTRQCKNPLPINGGKFCEGEHREYKLCNTKPCVDNRDFRDVQCEQKNKEMFNDKFFEWEWRPSNLKNKCTLGCFIKNTNKGYAFGNVDDGTNCDDDTDNKCVNGECMPVGCDGMIGSQAQPDRCGICNGDGSTCQFGNSTDEALKQNLTMKYKKQGTTFKKTLTLLKNLGYNVPQNYELVNTDELVSDFYWATVRTGCSATCGQGTEMSKSECRRSDDGSPVAFTKCDISKKPTEEITQCEMKHCKPEWRTDRWEICSKSCNGGKRVRHVKCVQMIGDQIEFDVEDDMCDKDTRPRSEENCNTQECEAEWVAQPFGQCTTSCGRGVQKRKVICQKTTKDGDVVDVDKGQCAKFIKPTSEEYCNVHNPCPGDGQCGGIHQANTGYLTSPGFPEPYPNEKECMHAITVPEDKVVKLLFKSFELSGAKNSQLDDSCSGDFIRIMDGDCHRRNGAETHYCGDSNTAPFLSTGNKLCLKFFSDESRTSKGFNASYEAVDHPARPKDPCGSEVTASIGLITSPNYPQPYPSNEICNTTIKTLEGPITLNFQYFDVGDKKCDGDYLLLHADSDTTKLCGSHLPKTYTANGSSLQLSFRSGESNDNRLGFVATYTSGSESKSSQKTEIVGKENTLSQVDSDSQSTNHIADSLRDTIPRPMNQQESKVNFLPISPTSSDIIEVAKQEVSGESPKVSGSAAKATLRNETSEANKTVAFTGDTDLPENKTVNGTVDKDTRQQILRPLQNVLEQSGALLMRGQCPRPERLSCINLLYSYPCQYNNQCELRGMDCCPTSCSYGQNMCVPKVWRECPLLTPYTQKSFETCTTTSDCQADSMCCIDMLGRRYCHKRERMRD